MPVHSLGGPKINLTEKSINVKSFEKVCPKMQYIAVIHEWLQHLKISVPSTTSQALFFIEKMYQHFQSLDFELEYQ